MGQPSLPPSHKRLWPDLQHDRPHHDPGIRSLLESLPSPPGQSWCAEKTRNADVPGPTEASATPGPPCRGEWVGVGRTSGQYRVPEADCTFGPRGSGAALCPHAGACADRQGYPGPQSAITQGGLGTGHYASFLASHGPPHHSPGLASFCLHFVSSPRLNLPSGGLESILHCYLQATPSYWNIEHLPTELPSQCQPETFPRPRIVHTCAFTPAGCVTCRAQHKMQGRAPCSEPEFLAGDSGVLTQTQNPSRGPLARTFSPSLHSPLPLFSFPFFLSRKADRAQGPPNSKCLADTEEKAPVRPASPEPLKMLPHKSFQSSLVGSDLADTTLVKPWKPRVLR